MNSMVEFSKSLEESICKLNKAIREFTESESFKELEFYGAAISSLQKLGEKYNWVVITPNIDVNVVKKDKEAINNYFVTLIENDTNLYESIKNELLQSHILRNKKKLMEQIINAINCKNFWISSIALSNILEFLLASESDYNSIKMHVLKNNLIDNVGDISIHEYEVAFLFSLEGFLNNYIAATKGFEEEKEPEFINRHWIAHGRMYRELTKIDSYQLLFAVYALIRVMDMEKRVKFEEENIETT